MQRVRRQGNVEKLSGGKAQQRFRALLQRTVPAVCVALAACAAREPVFIAPELAATPITTIALAPIIDARANRFADLEVLGYVRRGIEWALARKGYEVVPALSRDEPPHGAAELRAPTDAELAALVPEDVCYVLAVEVEQVARATEELGENTRTKLAGRLVDASTSRVVWRDIAEGDADLGGFLSLLRGTSSTFESAYDAAGLLLSTLPDRVREDSREGDGSESAAPCSTAVGLPTDGALP